MAQSLDCRITDLKLSLVHHIHPQELKDRRHHEFITQLLKLLNLFYKMSNNYFYSDIDVDAWSSEMTGRLKDLCFIS